ncbi:MAG TPA: PEGA domain-containing protein [Vicinamibacteria bacterium]|nr:PEGA domain-containing protein [Vicinamibacteria bacterium]
MSARRLLYLAVAAAMFAQPALSEDAKERSGSTNSSREVGSRHHSGSDSRSSDPGSSARAVPRSGSDSRSSGSEVGTSHYRSGSPGSSTTLTDAQRRHPRAGTGTGWRYGYPYHGGGYYGGYYPYYYPYYGWGYGYYPYGGFYLNSWWWTPPYYGYGAYVHDGYDAGSVRVLVDQHKARVYVDGYYAGIVDDFDGMFQRLHVAPGQHDITIKLEGYKTHTFSVHVPDDGTLKLRWEMEPGEGHDGTGDPTLAPPRREARRDRTDADRWSYRDRDREPRERDREAERDGFGALRFDVRPGDASVYVDGAFRGAARELRSLELPAGSHRIEIVRPGYRTFERDVSVSEGESVDLSADLER